MRGGYRVSYYTQPISDWFGSQQNQQIVSANFQNSVTQTQRCRLTVCRITVCARHPNTLRGSTRLNAIIDINDTRTIAPRLPAVQIDPDLTDPKVQEWNFTLEKEIANNMVTRLAYVGNRTTNVLQTSI